MDRPLDVTFHNLDSSPSVEAEIRRHVDKLDRRFSGLLVGCRVSVEALHKQYRTGNVVDVHIVLSVPGQDLAVSRQPQKAKDRHATPDIHTSIRDSFAAAERQLESYKGKLRTDTSAPSGSAITGQVALIEPDADHGFLLTNVGTQLYFHRDSVTSGTFDSLKSGDLVHYVEKEADSGPVAAKVWLARHTDEGSDDATLGQE